MKRSRNVLLLLLYAALFVFTLAVEWIGIRDPGMRALVNVSTLALVAFGGAACFFLYRKTLSTDEKREGGQAVEPGGKEQDKQRKKEESEPPVDRDAYLAFAREKGLTRRETELAFLVVNGYSNQRIAQELYISEATVKKHLTHIYEKTGANGRKELKRAAAGATGVSDSPFHSCWVGWIHGGENFPGS